MATALPRPPAQATYYVGYSGASLLRRESQLDHAVIRRLEDGQGTAADARAAADAFDRLAESDIAAGLREGLPEAALPDVLRHELAFLLKNTTPVAGELGACIESWANVLRALGLSQAEVEALLDPAAEAWELIRAMQKRGQR